MSENSKKNMITFRLNDENNSKLENMANTYNVQKSTMAGNIIINVLNENLQDLIINHISYPRPITKKLFSMLTETQVDQLILDLNEYNKDIIESAMDFHPSVKIIEMLKTWLKNSGCEISISSTQFKNVFEVHHEMEKNWSVVMCTTIAFTLELLKNEITRTFAADSWFKIEFTNY